MANILVLGAGFVAAPLIDFLLKDGANTIILASQFLSDSQRLASGRRRVVAKQLDVADSDALSQAVANSSIVVSLIPYQFHSLVAKSCIEHQKHLVTASYESDSIKALDDAAKQANITILNEIGLDPGIDHLTAMEVIDHAKATGRKVKSFVSWCGGLPCPADNDNPLGYKFAWSPRAVLLALLNNAQFMRHGIVVSLTEQELLDNVNTIAVDESLSLEGYANRNSTQYAKIYQIDDVDNLLRGTLRYRGFSTIMQTIKKMGLLSLAPYEAFESCDHDLSWQQLMEEKLGWTQQRIRSELKADEDTLAALEWLGLFDGTVKVDTAQGCLLDALCSLLQSRLAYESDEQDMVVLVHKFVIVDAAGNSECIQSTFIEEGQIGGYSAMAKTVGVPAAVACQLLLKDKIRTRGVILPTLPSVYKPVLSQLRQEGFSFKEQVMKMTPERFIPEMYNEPTSSTPD